MCFGYWMRFYGSKSGSYRKRSVWKRYRLTLIIYLLLRNRHATTMVSQSMWWRAGFRFIIWISWKGLSAKLAHSQKIIQGELAFRFNNTMYTIMDFLMCWFHGGHVKSFIFRVPGELFFMTGKSVVNMGGWEFPLTPSMNYNSPCHVTERLQMAERHTTHVLSLCDNSGLISPRAHWLQGVIFDTNSVSIHAKACI